MSVKDATGKVVRELESGAMKKGQNNVKWNGLTTEGLPARAGEYKFAIEATDSSGAKVYAKSAFEGRISGVDFTSSGPMVIVNGQSIKLSEVKKIEDPGMVQQQQNQTPGTSLGVGQSKKQQMVPPSAVQAMAKPFIPPAPEEEAPGNIESVPMAGNLLAQVHKAQE